jgi:hypothetical protein
MTLVSIGFIVSPFFEDFNIRQIVLVIAFGLLFSLLSFCQLLRDCKLIIVDTTEKSITFTNFLTRKKATYNFNDLDGFVDLYQPAKGGSYKVLYLVQNEKFVEKISTFIYSNFTEIENNIKELEYLGQRDYSYLKSIKIMFNYKVLND